MILEEKKGNAAPKFTSYLKPNLDFKSLASNWWKQFKNKFFSESSGSICSYFQAESSAMFLLSRLIDRSLFIGLFSSYNKKHLQSKITWDQEYFFFSLNHIHDGGEGRVQKDTPTSFSLVASTNVGISPENIMNFSLNSFATLV